MSRRKSQKRILSRRDKELIPSLREQRLEKASKLFLQAVQGSIKSDRNLARALSVHRDTAASIRAELGYVIPKKDFRCHKPRFDNDWPIQPGEKVGICACGCEGQTTRAKNNNTAQGIKQGDFYRFIAGHNWILRRKLRKPKGWRSHYEINQERERVRAELRSASIKLQEKKPVVTFDDLRSELGGQISIFGKVVNNQGISRMRLTIANFFSSNAPRVVAIRRDTRHYEPLGMFFPYIRGSGDEGTRLLLAVNALLPSWWNNDRRADIAQDIILEIVSGRMMLKEIKPNLNQFCRNFWHRYGMQGHMIVSIDAERERNGADLQSLHELIDSSAALTEMYGGRNFETMEQEYEKVEDGFNGQICARY